MHKFLTFFCLVLFLSSCSKITYYIVRHAEKATAAPNMSSDVPLTEQGMQRAEKLKTMLKNKNIGYIFSTQTIRTTSTAKPLSEAVDVPVTLYSHRDSLEKFIVRLKSIKGKSVLVVGHSNTVDDIVNKFMSDSLLADLPETEYDNLFIIAKRGTKYKFKREKY